MLFIMHVGPGQLKPVSSALYEIVALHHSAIPAFIRIVGIKNQTSPVIVNPHFKFIFRDKHSVNEKQVIFSVSVGCKCIRNKKSGLTMNANCLCN